MDSCIDLQTTLSHKNISFNPEIEQQRCRICYQQSKPLITLCECSGTIAYVHQDCILDWITKKMEHSQTVQIPKCQICRTTYSARLKIGRKKICHKLLIRKLKQRKLNDFLGLLFYLIASIFAMVIATNAILSAVKTILTYNVPTKATNQSATSISNTSTQSGLIMDFFKSVVYPIIFVRAAMAYWKKQLKILDESKVQIVQVTLNPKSIIKQ